MTYPKHINALKKPNYAFINGTPYIPTQASKIDVISPIDKTKITQIPHLSEADVHYAVSTAKKAFETGDWRDMPKRQKQQILLKFADLITQNVEWLAGLESLDMGMPYTMCQSKNIMGCADAIRWYAESIDKIYDETITDNNTVSLITREAVGVVGIITPWNFPSMIVGWKIAPALALGNSIVLKPAESASMATIVLAELAIQAGLPKGIFNVITGSGSVVGKALAMHPDVRVLAFTGSGSVGGKLLKYAGDSNLKRVFLELGGKNANIICNDVPDLNTAVENSVMALFANSGQICASPSRLLVQSNIYDTFVQKCISVAQNITVGNPFDTTNTLGPVANESQYNTVLDYIAQGKQQGAKCVLGGTPTQGLQGYYINPTIFADVSPDMTIAREEIFGPVLSIIRFNCIQDAINITNDSEYGLTAGVWTSNINTAHMVSKKLQSGTVFINHFGGADITLPFGGVKQSGNGVDKSLHALEKYCNLKTTILKLAEI